MSRVGARVCGSGAVRSGAELSEATRKSVCVEVILIKEFKSHSCGDYFSFGWDSDDRRRRAQPNVARSFSLTDHTFPLTTSLIGFGRACV